MTDFTPMTVEAINEGRPSNDIWLIDCPSCRRTSYYNNGFTCGCEHCGAEIAGYSDDAYTLLDLFDWEALNNYNWRELEE